MIHATDYKIKFCDYKIIELKRNILVSLYPNIFWQYTRVNQYSWHAYLWIIQSILKNILCQGFNGFCDIVTDIKICGIGTGIENSRLRLQHDFVMNIHNTD